MKVWYKLGEFDASKVEVSEDADVDDLKTKIKEKLTSALDATLDGVDLSRLTLLSGVNEDEKIQDIQHLGRSASNPFVYQVVEPLTRNRIPDHFAPILLDLAVKNMAIGWERISSERTSVESVNVRNMSISYYGLSGIKHCQILGPAAGSVQNAHIWPYNNRGNLKLADLEETDIDDPRNVLRLHNEIEHKFDRFAIAFVQSGGDLTLKVLDPGLKTSTTPLQGTHASFQSIDGKKLLLPSGNRPWKRLVGTHSILAHRHARDQGWLPEEQLTEAESSAVELMEWSLDEDAQARIKMLLNRTGLAS